jgi:hypothetical protein
MKLPIRLAVLGFCLANGASVGTADVIVDGQVIQGADISSISIDPVSGDVNIAAGDLYTVTRDGEPPPGPQVTIDTLDATPSTILVGESTVVSWTTTNADSCTPSQGAGGWDQQAIALPDGSSGPLTINTAGAYSFRLDCENATPDTTFRTKSVQVNEVPPDPGAGDVCPEEYVSPLSGNVVSWESVNNFLWPNPSYAENTISIPRAGYLAIEFNTGDNTEIDGGMTTLTVTGTEGSRLGSISECPGDFSQHLPDILNKCTRTWFIGGTLNWSTQTVPDFYECALEPDTTYYLNLTFTDGESAETDRCVGSVCRTRLRVFH